MLDSLALEAVDDELRRQAAENYREEREFEQLMRLCTERETWTIEVHKRSPGPKWRARHWLEQAEEAAERALEARKGMDETVMGYSEKGDSCLLAQWLMHIGNPGNLLVPRCKHMGTVRLGERDDCAHITSATTVGEKSDTLLGPEYINRDGEVLTFSQWHVEARDFRRENGMEHGPNTMGWYRLMPDEEDNDFSDFSNLQRKRAAWDLKAYLRKRDGEWIWCPNVRILWNRNTSQPLSVDENWEPPQIYEDLMVTRKEKAQSQICSLAMMLSSMGINLPETCQPHSYESSLVPQEVKVMKTERAWASAYQPLNPEDARCGLESVRQVRYRKNRKSPMQFRVRRTVDYTYTRMVEGMVPIYHWDENGEVKTFRGKDGRHYPKHQKFDVRRFVQGGMTFNESIQLAPQQGLAYSSNPKYSYTGTEANILLARFMDAVDRGDVELCKAKDGKGKTKRQVWMLIPITYKLRRPRNVKGVMTDKIKKNVVVFADVRN